MKTVKVAVLSALVLGSVGIGSSAVYADGPSEASTLNIEVKATTIKATVPTEASVLFNEDETVTVPTNFDITNDSTITDLSIVKFALDGGTDWTLASDAKDLKTNKSDTKEARIQVGPTTDNLQTIVPTAGESAATGSTSWANGTVNIKPGATQNIAFNVERGAFSEAIANAKAYGMQLDFEFTK